MKLGFGTRTRELLSRGERREAAAASTSCSGPPRRSAPSCLPLRLLPETNESGRKRKEEEGRESDAEEGGRAILWSPRLRRCACSLDGGFTAVPRGRKGDESERRKGWYEMARSGGGGHARRDTGPISLHHPTQLRQSSRRKFGQKRRRSSHDITFPEKQNRCQFARLILWDVIALQLGSSLCALATAKFV